MAFSDPFIVAYSLPSQRLWQELADAIADRRYLNYLIMGGMTPPGSPYVPEVYHLPQRIAWSRTYADYIANDLMFDKETIVPGTTEPTNKTPEAIHQDLWSDPDWDPPGAPFLGVTGIAHKDLWDYIRLHVLETNKHWLCRTVYQGWGANTVMGIVWEYDPYSPPYFDTWTQAKQNALDNMVEYHDGYHFWMGRRMWGGCHGSSGRYYCRARTVMGYKFPGLFGWDLSSMDNVPVLDRVFVGVKYKADLATYNRTPLPVDFYIGGHKCNSSPMNLEITEEIYKEQYMELDAYDRNNYSFDGTTYDYEIRFAGDYNGPVDDTEFPPPAQGEYDAWASTVYARSTSYGLYHLYTKLYYHFVWP